MHKFLLLVKRMPLRKNKAGWMRIWWRVSCEEEILTFLVLSTYEITECSRVHFHHLKMAEGISSHRRWLVTVSSQLILINGSHYRGTYFVSDTIIKCMLHLLTYNPYYNPVFKVGTILICIFENPIYLENSRARTDTRQPDFRVYVRRYSRTLSLSYNMANNEQRRDR